MAISRTLRAALRLQHRCAFVYNSVEGGPSLPKIEIYLLGPPRIERDGVEIRVDTRKAISLLAYLAVTGETQRRDALAALLWPESDTGRARGALRRTLSSLNRALEGEALVASRESLRLEPGPGLWLDMEEFRSLLAAYQAHGDPAEELSSLTRAVRLYRDDFMAGFTLRDSPAFDDWQYLQSEGLRRELAGALEGLARGSGVPGRARARHRPRAALALARPPGRVGAPLSDAALPLGRASVTPRYDSTESACGLSTWSSACPPLRRRLGYTRPSERTGRCRLHPYRPPDPCRRTMSRRSRLPPVAHPTTPWWAARPSGRQCWTPMGRSAAMAI